VREAAALYRLLDAWERHRAYPDTFDLPDPRAVARLRPGSLAKIGAEFDPAPEATDDAGAERFWTIVTEVEAVEGAPLYRGRIDNDLLYTERHGLSYGDVVTFGPRHILDVEVG
jgi:hypothetical protein